MRFILSLLAIGSWLLTSAQDFQLIKYKVRDGLPTDVIKSVTEDSLGFLWIGTDEGIAKFDGARFTHYKDALHSQYAKAFLTDKRGRIFLIGDLDLVEIQNRIDTAIIKTVRQGARNPTDSALWYPKSIYEDQSGVIWLGEPQAVTRLMGNALQRFPFGAEDQTPEFLRSFSFFEDLKNSLYTVSYFGRVYQFNPATSSFTLFAESFPSDVKSVELIDHTLWIAAGNGVYTAILNEQGGFSKPTLRFNIASPSCIEPLRDNRLFVGTTTNQQYVINLTEGSATALPFEITDVNAAFLSANHDLWLASSEGLILLQENLFRGIKFPEQETFIESIAEDTAHQAVYYATILNLFSSKIVKGVPTQHKVVLNTPRGYFQSVQVSSNGLWVSNRYSVSLLKNDKPFKTWDFENEGRFVFDLFKDSRENVWLSQDGSRKVKCITPDLILKYYPIPLDEKSNVNVVREDANGILAASAGTSHYLFHKRNEDSVFVDISVPVTFPVRSDFSIGDVAVSNGVVWLASSEGLLRYDYKTIELVDLGDLNRELSVKTVKIFNEDELLFCNSLGMIRYNFRTGDWWLYNEGNGLPSNAITARGILVGAHGKVWVGTSSGLAYSSSSVAMKSKSRMPLFTKAIVNGKQTNFLNGFHVSYGSFLNLMVSSNTYPQSKVNLQYRFAGQEWNNITASQLNISGLAAGAYTIEIRAKKTGGYDWSDVRTFSFVVNKPFWQQYWFIAFCIMVLVLVGWGSYNVSKRISRKRREELEKLLLEIKERNEEVQAQSEELIESHEALNKLYRQVSEQREELQTQAEELTEANQAQSKLYQALTEKNAEVEAQAEELYISNETIWKLNDDLERRVEEKSRDLLRTNEELSRYNSDLLQFSYSVSHNLRGPVARLLGLSSLMAGASDAVELKMMAEMMQNSSVELDTVLKDLTNIIDMRNNISHIREKVFFEEEWNRSCSMLRDQIKPDNKIFVDFSGAPFVYTVRALLQSILYNLLSNALKYQSPDRALTLHVRTWSDNQSTFIEIEDNGLGLDVKVQRDKLFKLYKRFHTHVPGRGLGLYLVKTQTELLNGTVSVESEINKGTTFCIAIPTPESTERQVFFDNETAFLYFDANINTTVITWKKEITPESYRLIFETVLRTLKTYNSPGWIADLRDQGVVEEAEQAWFAATILPEAIKSGLKRIAAIGFSDPKRQAYFQLMNKKGKELGFELRLFENLEEATEWMRGSFTAAKN